MKHSKKDLILVFASVIQASSLIFWAMNFSKMSILAHTFTFMGELLLYYYNPIVVTHNFLHTPFFKSSFLNNLFSTLNSMPLGLPQILYKYHHLNHHRHNNSMEDPSSTYLFGKNQKQEHWVSYCALGLFRDGTQVAWNQAIAKKEGHILAIELIASLSFWALLILISWKFFLFLYLPLFYFGWFLAHIENYYEHYKATAPAHRYGNAVSFYPRWYNILMFNEGFHQEHHISPQEHWTKRPSTEEKYKAQMAEAGAYNAKLPPLLGMFEK